MIPISLNVNENSKTYELNLQMDNRSVSLSREEHTPKYIGARAYCTPTDDGAIITLIDYGDTAEAGQYVSSVSETDGVIRVARANFADAIPAITETQIDNICTF